MYNSWIILAISRNKHHCCSLRNRLAFSLEPDFFVDANKTPEGLELPVLHFG